MNRIEFIGQTHQGSIVSIDDIVRFFDHTIAAYEIVSDIDNASVHGCTDNVNSSLKIQIDSSDTAKLQGLVSYINETIHNKKSIYGKSFNINATLEGNSVELFVRENVI